MLQIKALVEYYKEIYFTELIMLFFDVVIIVLCALHYKRFKTTTLFLYYALFDLIVLLINDSFKLFPWNNAIGRAHFISILNSLISLIELIVYTQFFKSILKARVVPQMVLLVQITFCSIYGGFLLEVTYGFISKLRMTTYIISVLEFLMLLPFCLVYFFQILQTPAIMPLSKRPSFYIVTGIFTFSVISIPYYLLDPLLTGIQMKYRALYGTLLYELPFIMNLGFLIRSFKCKSPVTI
jgi:hypothetical protein